MAVPTFLFRFFRREIPLRSTFYDVPVHLQAIKFTDGEQYNVIQDGQKIDIPLRRVFHSIIIIKIHDSIIYI